MTWETGLTLKQAIEFFIPNDPLEKLRQIQHQIDNFKPRSCIRGELSRDDIGVDDDYINNLRRKLKDKEDEIINFFKSASKNETIVFYGRKASIESDRTLISWDIISSLSYFSLNENYINIAEMRFWAVTIFPTLHAPDAVSFLTNRPLETFIDKYVWHDPEFMKMSRGHSFAPLVHRYDAGGALIPLKPEVSDISKAIEALNLPPKNVQEGEALAMMMPLARRINALMQLILSSKISMQGINSNNEKNDIPLSIWQDQKLSLCLASGSFWHVIDGKTSCEWQDVWFSDVSLYEADTSSQASSISKPFRKGPGRPPEFDYYQMMTDFLKFLNTNNKLKSIQTGVEFLECLEQTFKNRGTDPPSRDHLEDKVKELFQYAWNAFVKSS
jgi:hypothetical protein